MGKEWRCVYRGPNGEALGAWGKLEDNNPPIFPQTPRSKNQLLLASDGLPERSQEDCRVPLHQESCSRRASISPDMCTEAGQLWEQWPSSQGCSGRAEKSTNISEMEFNKPMATSDQSCQEGWDCRAGLEWGMGRYQGSTSVSTTMSDNARATPGSCPGYSRCCWVYLEAGGTGEISQRKMNLIWTLER